MKGTDQRLGKVVGWLVIAALIFYAGVSIGRGSVPAIEQVTEVTNKEENKPQTVDFSPFWKAWSVINEKFVSPATSTGVISDQEKVWGAIEGLAQSLKDPHTVFLPPTETELFESDVRGNFEGVGMEIGIRDGVVTVVAPLKDTPAYRAGIKAGDKIIKIGDKPTVNMTTEQAVSLIRGQGGTTVTLTVARNGLKEPLQFTLVRETINIPTIRTELLPNRIFLIELYSFSANAPDLFRKALREFIGANTDKLLIDLRGNPGGYLEASIDMASWFLPAGKVVVREDFGGKQDDVIYRSRGYDVFNENLKLVILVDGGSASASEILASALRDHGIAKLVGERTFGKGSVQELIKITSETSLKLTIARWLTPNGISISESGVTPDFAVKITKEDAEKNRDPQKEKAIEILLN
ncbi:S41 family peptidase [Patescibacteria group bacterium]|nr:MAG: S41 family peptidase [Patescibacteria group bacterium]